MSSRVVSVFSCPTPLYDEVKTISEQEMISISAFCRMAVKSLVKDYQGTTLAAEETPVQGSIPS